MPRDLSGNYTLPAGNPVVTNTIIASTWANTTLADLATAMTNSLDRTGTAAGMTGQFKSVAGNVSAPGLSWQLEPTSGWYRNATNDFRYSVGGTDILLVGTTGTIPLTVNGRIKAIGSGGANNSELDIFNTDVSGGQWRIGDAIGASAGTFCIYDSLNTVLRLTLNSSGTFVFNTSSGANIQLSAVAQINLNGPAATLLGGIVWTQGAQSYWQLYQAGSSTDLTLFNSSLSATVIAFHQTGGVTITKPSSSVDTLQVTGASGSAGYAVDIICNNTAGNNQGLVIHCGASSSDTGSNPLYITNSAASAGYFNVIGDGEVLICVPPSAAETGIALGSNTGFQVGYMEMPNNVQSGSTYTLAITDRGKAVQMNVNCTLTIPANASIPFPVGTVILLISANTTDTINITTDTLRFVPSNATGSRTLGPWGVATLYKRATNEWLIWGLNIS